MRTWGDEDGDISDITSRRWEHHHQDDAPSAIIDTSAARPQQRYSAAHKAFHHHVAFCGSTLGPQSHLLLSRRKFCNMSMVYGSVSGSGAHVVL